MNWGNWLQRWELFAVGSAFFAGLTAILGKLGVAGINSNLATFIRTLVILAVTAALLSVRGEWRRPERNLTAQLGKLWDSPPIPTACGPDDERVFTGSTA